MQGRMKEHPLSQEEITNLLLTEPVGNLGTLSPKGFPYITPVHFVYINHKIYIHGLCKGTKIDHIKTNPNVGFEVYKLNGLIHDPNLPCDTNTDYQSVIIMGNADFIEDESLKINILNQVVEKFAPQHMGKDFPPAMLKATAIISITPLEITGKYFK